MEDNHIYSRLGIRPFINAADSYTTIGGSRMPPAVLEAMRQAAEHFVELDVLHDRIGERIAELTRNEAAMVTSGAAAGLALTVAACIAGEDPAKRRAFPHLEGLRNEVIIHRCQRNGFDMTVAHLGVTIVEIGSEAGTTARELEDAIGPRTACILYFDTSAFIRKALPLDEVVRIARSKGTAVIVDAAAQLPPVHNLWRYTQRGVDLVIFSGGKTLMGPQSTGLIVGRKELVLMCRLQAGPASDTIGRPMKVGREEMAGLYAAIELYLKHDHEEIRSRHERVVETFCNELAALGYSTNRVYPGPTGQDYPYAMFDMRGTGRTAESIMQRMKSGEPAVLIGLARDGSNQFFLNPLHVKDDEIPIIIERFRELGPVE
ncbi:aminotransferase class V-fold PLP-dependent enzyme [Paenibacillus mendelii]|uniref:Aminotransferase class V-fold PLP-dependent enzyme n=1 Tax=Paenibacillus mendelii TaxID=206163 RepID=A0ABV6JFN0_9BACL|nr:aminotransferase class V-fold PLP-dependent enzyme [Paenibacillus mendelii]MCQ6557602.1 aminotransferase class V-fold PLP-dependent enzyme [Paenibacillus mendelii]